MAQRLSCFLLVTSINFPSSRRILIWQAAECKVLGDVIDYVSAEKRYGNEVTFTGFVPDTDEDKNEIGRIDLFGSGQRRMLEVSGTRGARHTQ